MNELSGSFKQLVCDLSLLPSRVSCSEKNVNKILGYFISGRVFFDQFTGYDKPFSADIVKAIYWSKTSSLACWLRNLTNLETGELVSREVFCYQIHVSPQLMKSIGAMYEESGRIRVSGVIVGSGITNSFELYPDKAELLEADYEFEYCFEDNELEI